jgi:hypothetical protein
MPEPEYTPPVPVAELDRVCECGHELRSHFGRGPCIAPHGNADATVCPCTGFREATR